MIINFIVYEPSGLIVKTGVCEEGLESNHATGEQSVLTGYAANSFYDYIDLTTTPTVTSKVEMSITLNKTTIIADTVDQIIVSNLPNPVKVMWPDGSTEETTDTQATFSTNTPGDYSITFSGPQWLNEIVTVTADPFYG